MGVIPPRHVNAISRESPFRHQTALRVGMRVLRINGIDITGMEMTFVMALLNQSLGQVVIDAMDNEHEEWL